MREEPEPYIPRRKRGPGINRTGLLIAGVLLVVVVGLVVGLNFRSPNRHKAATDSPKDRPSPPTPDHTLTKPGPVPSTPPRDWTHAELLALLREKGLSLDTKPLPLFDTSERISAVFFDVNNTSAGVRVFLYKTESQAKTAAGAMGNKGFAYRQFAINEFPRNNSPQTEEDAHEFFERIRAALR